MAENQKKPVRIEGNRHVNHDLLERVDKLRKELEAHGVTRDRGYRIAPALGGELSDAFPTTDFPRTRGTSAWSVSSDLER